MGLERKKLLKKRIKPTTPKEIASNKHQISQKLRDGFEILQRASKEEDEKRDIIASKALDILMGSKAGLSRWRRERVRIKGANKSFRPRWGIAGEVVGGQFWKGVKSKDRNKSFEMGKEEDEDAITDCCRSLRSTTTGGGGGGGGGRWGVGGVCDGGDAVEVGGFLVKNFKVAFVTKPRLENRVGYA